ncbi:MAG TPA: peptidylprolyl isomerase [Candidatus Polarisedimenticolaceae bacterium]|nr:peptidylprolyl isomerase [Candidatus Polarisedimenticolaceae bacterium]
MRRVIGSWFVFLSMATAAGAATPAKPAAAPVKAVLELNQQFYYVGEPLNIRVTLSNPGAAEVSNPVKSPVIGAFTVADASGAKIAPTGKSAAEEPARRAKLAPKEFYGVAVELSKVYPQLSTKGRYTIGWSADGVAADSIIVTVIPKFDPGKNYSAKVETEAGTFTIDLMKSTAPIATKSFVDMANAGFYDGLLIHEIRSDQAIAGGDPTGTGGGQAPIRFPAELSAIPVVAGTVVLKPAGLAPPANSSQFIISLRPEPKWTGQFTVLGQVTNGLEVVKKISNLPSTDRPNFRPMTEIHTVHVTVIEN